MHSSQTALLPHTAEAGEHSQLGLAEVLVVERAARKPVRRQISSEQAAAAPGAVAWQGAGDARRAVGLQTQECPCARHGAGSAHLRGAMRVFRGCGSVFTSAELAPIWAFAFVFTPALSALHDFASLVWAAQTL
jgi:hypothetical protein